MSTDTELTIDEAKKRIDALSPPAKWWLKQVCEQVADDHSWSDQPRERAECEGVGLVAIRGGYLHIHEPVQEIVYSGQYLAAIGTQ